MKKGNARFVSHLDMNRFMTRIVRKAGLDIWYTEGFNPHPYITFALPLPLGFEGRYEIMDIRLNNDDFDISKLVSMLNGVCPSDIQFFDAKEPIKKVGEIAFAKYEILFDDNGEIRNKLNSFLVKKPIICRKRTKKGDFKEIDLSEKIKDFQTTLEGDNTKLMLILPAGSNDNVNPSILFEAFYNENPNAYYCYDVKRISILDKNLKDFL
ncbi:MAG: TIGR03936 family radical SAM-associated protein [Clostridia bacterium]|nr:TIGR03936 family radical SAM-associated protein [Clostridia bacterium]